ncbi:glycosyltransferase family 2 protein [Paenibacillus senegalensis]|uniref:glycosyltransferase family 2 protein n=1 Tax=Paenibacillus senegalensis TaxID=1465766 RepID=UPI000289207B|nr:glycosyltransferase family 2 protein [Paenibacillus senegalensis]
MSNGNHYSPEMYVSKLQDEINKISEELAQEERKEKYLLNDLNLIISEKNLVMSQLRKLEREQELSRRRVHSLRVSRSWRMMAPLRILSNLIKGNKVKSSNKLEAGALKKREQELVELNLKLHKFGFTKKALNDLHTFTNNVSNKRIRALAAYYLSYWYTTKFSEESSKKALECIQIIRDSHSSIGKARDRIVWMMEAECYKTLKQYNKAKVIIMKAIALEDHPELFFTAANMETEVDARLYWINKTFRMYNLPVIHIGHDISEDSSPLDNIMVGEVQSIYPSLSSPPKISVIMPVYNSERVIATAIKSVIQQTWENIEIIVADDCSTDNTVEVVKRLMQYDHRIKLVQSKINQGAYTVRNKALQIATGSFVTCHDADDWSHPLKLEIQAVHLMENTSVMANISEAIRISEDFLFYQKGKIGKKLLSNTSSLMFRRYEVTRDLGYWDSVRFSADSEFLYRLRKRYGIDAVVQLSTGPLSFARLSKNSLTANPKFGTAGFIMGARRVYADRYNTFHYKASDDELRYDFPQLNRPFRVPNPMLPNRSLKKKNYDIVFASDLRLHENSELLGNLVRLCRRKNLRIGTIELFSYNVSVDKKIDSDILEIIDSGDVDIIVYGEEVVCRRLIISHLPVLAEHQDFVPTIETENVFVVADDDLSLAKERKWDFDQMNSNIYSYFGRKAQWFISREKFPKYSTSFGMLELEDFETIDELIH